MPPQTKLVLPKSHKALEKYTQENLSCKIMVALQEGLAKEPQVPQVLGEVEQLQVAALKYKN